MQTMNQDVVVESDSALNWSAIFAGWFVAVAIAALFYAAGLALGFSAFDPYQAAVTAKGISFGAGLWMVFTWGAALFLGSMFASWFDGRNDTEMGVMRGLTVWGVSVTTTGLLLASGLSRILYVAPSVDADTTAVSQELVAHYTSMVMWVAFACVLLALLASALGGWFGARHIAHVYHFRTYRPHGRV